MIRRIAHHTSGEARPLIPVQEKALSGSATSIAPRFRRNSDTSTQATLKPSCSHGLRKPEGRPRIRFSSLSRFHRNQIRFSRLLLGRVTPCAPHVRRAEDCPPYQPQSSCALGNFRKTGSCLVGPRYLITRRNAGFSTALVCRT